MDGIVAVTFRVEILYGSTLRLILGYMFGTSIYNVLYMDVEDIAFPLFGFAESPHYNVHSLPFPEVICVNLISFPESKAKIVAEGFLLLVFIFE